MSNTNKALTSAQFQDAITRILAHSLAKGELPNADVLKDITTKDLLLWSNSLIHIGNTQPSEPTKYPVWVDTSGTPIMKYRVDKSDGGFEYVETTSGKSAYTIAVENGFQGDEKTWLASLVGKGTKGDAGESAYDSAKKGGYTGTKSEFYSLLADLTRPAYENVSFIHFGADEPTDESLLYWADTSVTPALWKYKNEDGIWTLFAGGSGGGGGSTSNVETALTPEWTEKTLSYGNDCEITFDWYSTDGGNPTGMGSFVLYLNTANGEEKKESYRIKQGTHKVNLKSYLTLGDTEFILQATDRLGNQRRAYITVSTVQLSLENAFSSSIPYTTNPVTFKCIPKGANNIGKSLHIYLDDALAVSQTFTSSGSTISNSLTVTGHGVHSIRAYFTCQLEEGAEPIKSEEIYCEFAFLEEGNTEPVIVADLGIDSIKQFESHPIKWYVFTPNGDGTVAAFTPSVNIYESNQDILLEGATPEQSLVDVGQGQEFEYPYKAVQIGHNYIIFAVGEYYRSLHINVEKNAIEVTAQTDGLALYLSSAKRDNGEAPEERKLWSYEGISAELTDFNFTSDGWVFDDTGKNKVLRLRDEARVHIPYNIFTNDIASSGVTVELELATREVLNDDALVLTCMNSGIGIQITAKQATMKSALEHLTTPFRDGEHIRLTFVIEPVNSVRRLMSIYINGVWSGTKQFTTSDSFAQSSPQGITIGSKFCTTDIYCIRVYNTVLERRAILNNWIADTQDVELLIQRAKRNDVFDGNDQVSISKLPEGLSALVVNAGEDESETELPQFKGDKKIRSGYYTNPLFPSKSFTYANAKWNVQGTSSSGYARKNYTVIFEEGIIINGKKEYEVSIFEDGIPVNRFCLKADVASSEGANNVELVRLFNEICPVKIPPQMENDSIRQGIDGFPIVLYRYDGTNYHFMGKYNFNNDKGTPEVYGMIDGVESWEVKNNATPMGEYKDADFDALVTNEKGEVVPSWLSTFEARYPEDNEDYTNLKEMVSWVYSTWRENASDTRKLDVPITYGDKTYEYDNAEYRKAKFLNEVDNYFDRGHLVFFYTYTDVFLMTDNREKNTFPTRYFNKELNKWLWYFLPYDYDTAMGINNSGELTFGHSLEDTDMISADEYVFNGAESVLFCNVRDYLGDEVRDMYRELRSSGKLSYESVRDRFTEHQRLWGEAIFNEDAYVKYIEPADATYHPMLLGDKAAQRDYWLYYRFKYYDSKYTCGDTRANFIRIRVNNADSLFMKPYADTYGSISYEVQAEPATQRMLKEDGNKFYEFPYPSSLGDPQGAVVDILNADMLSDINGLENLAISEFRGKKAVRLQRLNIGNKDVVNENFKLLELENNKLLKVVNAVNCPNLKQAVNLQGCSGIEEVYLENTQVTSCLLPRGGSCKVLHLPSSVVDLTVINHKATDFSMTDSEGKTSYDNLTTLWLDLNDTCKGTFDIRTMVNTMIERFKASEEGEKGKLRLTNFELLGDKGFATAQDVLDFYADIKKYFVGLNTNGDIQDTIELKGRIEIAESVILGSQLKQMEKEFPEVKIVYNKVQSEIVIFHDEAHTREYFRYTVTDNENCPDPVKTLGYAPPTMFVPSSTNNGGTEDNTARYTFMEWSGSLLNVDDYRELHAVYKKELKYCRRFLDKDNNYIKVNDKEENFYYNTDSERNVIEPPNHATWRSTVNGLPYDNIFIGWTDDGTNVYPSQVPDISLGSSTDINYRPMFRRERVYIVKYVRDDGTLIKQEEYYINGVLKQPAVPTKPSTNYYTFDFTRWLDSEGNEISSIAGTVVDRDITFAAEFDPIDRYYTVVFKKHDGTELQSFTHKLYREDYGSSLYTGVSEWLTNSPRYKKEELKGWRVSVSGDTLYYTAKLYTTEKATLSYYAHNSGAWNPGEPEYICDGNMNTTRGFNIGVDTAVQGLITQAFHAFVRTKVKLSTLPADTTIHGFTAVTYTNRTGASGEKCRFRSYFEYILNISVIDDLGGTGNIEDSTSSGSKTFTRTESSLSSALSWMNRNIGSINAGKLLWTIKGSNFYVYETEIMFTYTT